MPVDGGWANSPFTSAYVDTRPLSTHIGGIVQGNVEPRNPDPEYWRAIERALAHHKLLVFRAQSIDPEEQISVASRFGVPAVHPVAAVQDPALPVLAWISNRGADGRPTRIHPDPGVLLWHIDGSCGTSEIALTLLFAEVVAPQGGETEFVNLEHAWTTLDERLRERCETRSAIHRADRWLDGAPAASHPLRKQHPRTGFPILYISEHATANDRDAEGAALLDAVLSHATGLERVYRHRWKPGDFMLCDNRAVLHRSIAYDVSQHVRVLRRVSVLGAP